MKPSFLHKKFSVILADVPWSYDDKLLADNMRGGADDHYDTMEESWLANLPIHRLMADDAVLFQWVTGPMLVDGTCYNVTREWGRVRSEDEEKPDKFVIEQKTMAFVWRKLNKKKRLFSKLLKTWRGMSGQGWYWPIFNHLRGTPFYGLGRYTRSNYEFVTLSVKGKPKRVGKGVRQEIEWPLASHSQKPPVIRDMIVELMGDVPRLELFARSDDKHEAYKYPPFSTYEEKYKDGWDFTGLEYDGYDIRNLASDLDQIEAASEMTRINQELGLYD